MKKYFHEDSPFDEVFKGVRSYNEVISRFQNLPDKEQSSFLISKSTGGVVYPRFYKQSKVLLIMVIQFHM
jgi:hypothetical protein